jgi:hypothetical protein
MAPRFFELALLDGLSYNEKTRKGGPDGSVSRQHGYLTFYQVAASIQLPGARYDSLNEALEILRESQKALKRTNALTLADLIALAGELGSSQKMIIFLKSSDIHASSTRSGVGCGGWRA